MIIFIEFFERIELARLCMGIFSQNEICSFVTLPEIPQKMSCSFTTWHSQSAAKFVVRYLLHHLFNVMSCAILFHLYNLKNAKNTHKGVLLLEFATLLKLTLLHGCFSRF